MQKDLNLDVKHRALFRPTARVVLPQDAAVSSDIDEVNGYMPLLHGYRIWPRTDLAKSLDHPDRLRFLRIDMSGRAWRRTLRASSPRMARFSGPWSLRLRVPPSSKVVSSTQCRQFSIRQCARAAREALGVAGSRGEGVAPRQGCPACLLDLSLDYRQSRQPGNGRSSGYRRSEASQATSWLTLWRRVSIRP